MVRLVVFLIFLSSPVLACDYCNPNVTLNRLLADCYLERFETEIRQMEEAGLPAQLVNLASCEDVEGLKRGGSSMPSPRIATGKQEEAPNLSFVMDADGMRCLAERLKQEPWSPDVAQTFEIRRDCQAR